MQVHASGKHINAQNDEGDNNVTFRKRTRLFALVRENRSMFRPFDVRFSTEHHHRIVSNTDSDILTVAEDGNQSLQEHPYAVGANAVDENDHVAKTDSDLFFGAYGHLRKKLDYSYHCHYRKERQWLHDSIIEDFLEHQEELHLLVDQANEPGIGTLTPPNNTDETGSQFAIQARSNGSIPLWLILSVGIQGAGKHYTINKLVENGRLRVVPFVSISPDDICHYLPEYSAYCEKYPDKIVDELTKKESGYIAETIVLATFEAGRNAILHCQLGDSQWYKHYVKDFLRQQYPTLKVALFHIVADKEIIKSRRSSRLLEHQNSIVEGNVQSLDLQKRGNVRIRQVSIDDETDDKDIDEALERIPNAVSVVKPVVDFFSVIHNQNHGDPLIVSLSTSPSCTSTTTSSDWSSFTQTFRQMESDTAKYFSPALSNSNQLLTQGKNIKYCNILQKSLCRRKTCRSKVFTPQHSTEEYHRSDDTMFYGQFAHLRDQLDYSYHSNYTRERQFFQDSVIREFLSAAIIKDQNGEVCTTPTEPWIVFTAGAMGAGKSYTMNKLVQQGRFPLLAFVQVDPDAIRRLLPEFPLYVKENPENVGELTGKEAGLIAELLTLAGLTAGKNVLVDGSLRHSQWYEEYFAKLRKQFGNLKISIIHVTAPQEAVFKRAEQRAKETGRIVPCEVLIEALEQVPKSVKHLAPLVDYHVELRNDPNSTDIELVTEGETWESFERRWIQTCAWVPKNKKKILEKSKLLETKLASYVAR